ncbi:MAG: hypothetical protein KDA24_16585 [Deltaproteobacteria bacterium]|nr:hypothetical protein [Deltaproteobacteria bacterium]
MMRGRQSIRRAVFAALLAGLTGCAASGGGETSGIGALTWDSYGDPGTMKSAEWIRYRTTSNVTFAQDLTLNYFVMTNVSDFCTSYQDAIGASFGAFQAFTAARQPFESEDDLRNPQVCALTVDYFNALADATEPLTEPGAFYLTSSIGLQSPPGDGGLVYEEGAPVAGTYSLTNDPLAEDGDFFRLFARFYSDNPYRMMADEIDCSDPNWGEVYDFLGYREYVAEPRADQSGGGLAMNIVSDTTVGVVHDDVLTVDRHRASAGTVDSDAEYLLCDISTDAFFLRIFDR